MPQYDGDVKAKDAAWHNRPAYEKDLWYPDGIERDDEQRRVRAFNNRTFDVTKAVPTVVMRNEDYGRLARLMADGRTIELEINIVNRTHPEGATAYNVVAIPLAAGVPAPGAWCSIPAVGAVLMSASTVMVAVNAQLLRRAEL